MVKAVFAAIPATAVVMTMAVSVGATEVAVMVPTDVEPAALFAGVGSSPIADFIINHCLNLFCLRHKKKTSNLP
jgi:hypothetical protein